MSKKQDGRPKVTGVTINLEYPDGSSRTVTIDPGITEGIFWSDKAVLEILDPYYKGRERVVTKQELIKDLGKRGAKIAGKEEKIKVAPGLVKKMWETKDEDGNLPALFEKTIFCIPAPGP